MVNGIFPSCHRLRSSQRFIYHHWDHLVSPPSRNILNRSDDLIGLIIPSRNILKRSDDLIGLITPRIYRLCISILLLPCLMVYYIVFVLCFIVFLVSLHGD